MPRPFPIGSPYSVQPQGVLSRPNCAELLGAIVAEWALLEASLAATYAGLAVGHAETGDEATLSHWIAMETFETASTFAQKRQILLAAATRRGLNKDGAKALQALLSKAQERSAGRNHAAHGRWMLSSDFPDDIIYVRNGGRLEDAQIYTPADLRDVLKGITAVAVELENFYRASIRPLMGADNGRSVDANVP